MGGCDIFNGKFTPVSRLRPRDLSRNPDVRTKYGGTEDKQTAWRLPASNR